MKKNSMALPLLILCFAAAVSLYVFRPGGDVFYDITTFVMNMMALSVIVVFSAVLSYTYGWKSNLGKSMGLLSLALFVDILAEASWWVLGAPVISISDIFFLLYYPIFVASVYFGMKAANKDFLNDKKRMSLIYLLIVGVVAIYLFLMRLAWKGGQDFLTNFLTTGYIFLDMIIVIVLVFLCFAIIYGNLSKAWLSVLFFAILNALSDVEYALDYEVVSDLYFLIGFTAYLVLIYGLIVFKRTTDEAKDFLMKKAP